MPYTYLTPSAGCNDSPDFSSFIQARLILLCAPPMQCVCGHHPGETSGPPHWCSVVRNQAPPFALATASPTTTSQADTCSTISDDVGTIVNIGGEESCAGPRAPPSSLAHAY